MAAEKIAKETKWVAILPPLRRARVKNIAIFDQYLALSENDIT